MIDPEEINYPLERLIKMPRVQRWIYDHMFNQENVSIYAPYAFRVLKKLLFILEAAIEDPEEDEILDDLANCFASMLTKTTEDGLESIQKKRPVTYTAPVADANAPTVTILEAPNLLSSNGDTGNRTWDAALVLATFLFGDGRHFVQNKSILELGAGLGFVSVLCGKHLEARRVLITDASEPVLCTAQQNIEMNGVGEIVRTAVLEWGTPDLNRALRSEDEAISYDLVLGSDMLYEPRDFPALMSTLQDLFSRYSKIQVLISSAIRREATLESFLIACTQLYERLTSQVVPLFFNIVDARGLWKIPRTPDHTTEAIAVAMNSMQPRWAPYCKDPEGGLIVVSMPPLTDIEIYDILAGRYPPTLAQLGKPAPGICGEPVGPARPSLGPSMNDLYVVERNRIGQPPLPQTHRYIGQGSLPLDHSYISQTPVPLALDQRRLEMNLRPGPSRQPRPVRQRPMVPLEHTSHISVSSSNSTDSSDAETGSGSQSSSGSGSESEAPRKSTKGKSTKGKSQKKSGVKPKGKSQRGHQSSSESESDDDTSRRPMKTVKDKIKGKAKPTARKSTRALGRSDDEEGPSAPVRRRPAAKKDRRDPESEDLGRGHQAPRPSSKTAGKMLGGQPRGKSRGRSPSDDEAPPHVDPIEQAKLAALKAQNGYGE
ncbi:MAG: hypothetical protein Q9213_007878 [Squamulea squamosa]